MHLYIMTTLNQVYLFNQYTMFSLLVYITDSSGFFYKYKPVTSNVSNAICKNSISIKYTNAVGILLVIL